MSARTNILSKIKTSLRTKAPVPPQPGNGTVFPPLPSTDLISHFERELISLKGEFYKASNLQSAQDWIRQVISQNNFKNVNQAPDPLVTQVASTDKSPPGQFGSALKDCELSITPCSYLIARTGSVVITTESGYGRSFSVLPHAHMVVARKSQLIADLSDAYQLLRRQYNDRWPSLISIITGPSRTADIEKILVLGAHGPKRLFVLLLDF